MLFCFQALFKGKKVCICWVFFYFLLLETAPNFKIFQSSLRNKRCLHNGPEVACNINSLKTGKNPNIYVSSPKDKLLPVACPGLRLQSIVLIFRFPDKYDGIQAKFEIPQWLEKSKSC